jgi:hypothetical protein
MSVVPVLLRATGAVCAALAVACSSTGGSAIRTGPLQLPAHVGAVALYSAGEQVEGTDVGVVEVHAAQGEATIDSLVPLFVQKAAQIGGNAAVIDTVSARFQIANVPHMETYSFSCGRGSLCVGQRMYSVGDEMMIVSIQGRAVATGLPRAASGTSPSGTPSPAKGEGAP